MQKSTIIHSSHPIYEQWQALYQSSFPPFEQRQVAQQLQAMADPRYRLEIYHTADQLIGFIASWHLDCYIYIEHFAINHSLRGKGYGSELLNRFLSETKKRVILEIDPPIDTISQTRLRFYTNLGFISNDFTHIHPPYKADHSGHGLIVMSSDEKLSDTQYQQFADDLANVVMHNPTNNQSKQ